MPPVSQPDQPSDSSLSDSQNLSPHHPHHYLDQLKIQSFYQTAKRLQKFTQDAKLLDLEDNPELAKYLAKFHQPQNQLRNDDLQAGNIHKLAQQRVERMIKSQKPKKNWTLDDRTILNWVVTHVALKNNYKNVEKQFTKDDWNLVASLIPGANTNSCMFKWLSLHKTNLNEANWSEEESELLKTLVSKYVNANKSIMWKEVCKKLYLMNSASSKNYRTRKQCKEHWVCKLNPNIKREPWTQEEDILLLQTIKQNSGLKKWVEMVKLFNGRTENAVKNRFNLIIEKEKKFVGKCKDELELINGYLQRCYVEKFTMIIEPDSEEKKGERVKTKRKRTKKGKKGRKEGRKEEEKVQEKDEMKWEEVKGEKEEFGMSKGSLSSGQQTMEQLLQSKGKEELFSMESLGQMMSFNHRANDSEYEFMCFNSSLMDED